MGQFPFRITASQNGIEPSLEVSVGLQLLKPGLFAKIKKLVVVAMIAKVRRPLGIAAQSKLPIIVKKLAKLGRAVAESKWWRNGRGHEASKKKGS